MAMGVREYDSNKLTIQQMVSSLAPPAGQGGLQEEKITTAVNTTSSPLNPENVTSISASPESSSLSLKSRTSTWPTPYIQISPSDPIDKPAGRMSQSITWSSNPEGKPKTTEPSAYRASIIELKPRSRSVGASLITPSTIHDMSYARTFSPNFDAEMAMLASLQASLDLVEHRQNCTKLPAVKRDIARAVQGMNIKFLNDIEAAFQEDTTYKALSEQVTNRFQQLCKSTGKFVRLIEIIKKCLDKTTIQHHGRDLDITDFRTALAGYLSKDRDNVKFIKKNEKSDFLKLVLTKEGISVSIRMRWHLDYCLALHKSYLKTFHSREIATKETVWIEWGKDKQLLALTELMAQLSIICKSRLEQCKQLKDDIQGLKDLKKNIPSPRETRALQIIEENWMPFLKSGDNVKKEKM